MAVLTEKGRPERRAIANRLRPSFVGAVKCTGCPVFYFSREFLLRIARAAALVILRASCIEIKARAIAKNALPNK
jgi:hypothetical protein